MTGERGPGPARGWQALPGDKLGKGSLPAPAAASGSTPGGQVGNQLLTACHVLPATHSIQHKAHSTQHMESYVQGCTRVGICSRYCACKVCMADAVLQALGRTATTAVLHVLLTQTVCS